MSTPSASAGHDHGGVARDWSGGPAGGSQSSAGRRGHQGTPGTNYFTAPQPLDDIGDVGGALCVGSNTYGCLIAPAKYLRGTARQAR